MEDSSVVYKRNDQPKEDQPPVDNSAPTIHRIRIITSRHKYQSQTRRT
jgi:hypothetical protein